MSFDELNLNTPLLNALRDLNMSTPTPIQANAFSVIMSGKDVVGIAQTGTGKTFAYLLPLMRLWKYSENPEPTILILVPTRELVEQVVSEAEKLASYTSIKVLGVYGGVNLKTHAAAVFGGCDILVATPGRLLDLLYNRTLKAKNIKKVVIDEVDEMFNHGFRTQLTNIFDLLPPKRQNIMFSATLTEDVDKIINTFFSLPEKIQVAPSGQPLEQIKQVGYKIENFNTKMNLLQYLLSKDESMTKVLVFVSTKKFADYVFETLEEEFGERMSIIHSNKSQNFRLRAVNDFESGKSNILIATDIVARGVDISNISHVINFDIPEEAENYIHRIGRTARAEKSGVAINFYTEKEELNLLIIEELMQKEIDKLPFPEEVAINEALIDEEKPSFKGDKLIGKKPTLKHSKGAFHEKKEKNKKVNLGSKYRIAKNKKRKK